MSKTKLKAAISELNDNQLKELILELYDARKEAKEYLDFFAEPNIEALTTKYKNTLAKECGRISRGRSKPRMSKVKKAIKDFASFNPGDDYVAEIMVTAIELLCHAGSETWMPEQIQKSVAKQLETVVGYLLTHDSQEAMLPRIERSINDMKSSVFYRNQFKRLMKETLEESLAAYGIVTD